MNTPTLWLVICHHIDGKVTLQYTVATENKEVDAPLVLVRNKLREKVKVVSDWDLHCIRLDFGEPRFIAFETRVDIVSVVGASDYKTHQETIDSLFFKHSVVDLKLDFSKS